MIREFESGYDTEFDSIGLRPKNSAYPYMSGGLIVAHDIFEHYFPDESIAGEIIAHGIMFVTRETKYYVNPSWTKYLVEELFGTDLERYPYESAVKQFGLWGSVSIKYKDKKSHPLESYKFEKMIRGYLTYYKAIEAQCHYSSAQIETLLRAGVRMALKRYPKHLSIGYSFEKLEQDIEKILRCREPYENFEVIIKMCLKDLYFQISVIELEY